MFFFYIVAGFNLRMSSGFVVKMAKKTKQTKIPSDAKNAFLSGVVRESFVVHPRRAGHKSSSSSSCLFFVGMRRRSRRVGGGAISKEKMNPDGGVRKKARTEKENPFLALNGFEKDFLRLLLVELDIESAANASAVCRRWRRIILYESAFYWERQTTRLCFHGFFYPFGFTKRKFKMALYWVFHNYNAADPTHLKAVFHLFKHELHQTHTNPHVARILECYTGSKIQPFTYTVELAKNWYLIELPPPYKIGDDFLVDWAQDDNERRNLYFCENYAILTRSTVRNNRRWTPWTLLHASDLIEPYRKSILNLSMTAAKN